MKNGFGGRIAGAGVDDLPTGGLLHQGATLVCDLSGISVRQGYFFSVSQDQHGLIGTGKDGEGGGIM